MAFRDLMIGVGIDSSGFRAGVAKLRSESAALKMSMGALAGTITDQVRELNKMAKAGDTTSDAFKELQGQIKKNEKAFKDMGREAKWVDNQLSKMEGPKMKDMLGGISLGQIAAFAGIASVGEMFRGAINDASDLSETIAKTGVIFGDAQGQVMAFAETAASSIGQSKQQAMDAAATFGVFGKSAGLAGSDLAKFSTDFVKLASDMASFSNTTPEQAITAIGAALRGESEPIRQYGVLLNDAEMRQKAMALGIYDGNGALTSQQKILAAQALIYEQTRDAQGDFARTSEGLANQQRILAAEFTNASAELGNALLPAALAGVQGLRGLIEVTVSVASAIKTTLPGLAAIAAGLAIYNAQALIAKVRTMDMAKAKAYYTTIVNIAKNAQNLFNLAFAMSPVGRVVQIIGLAVSAFGLLYVTIKPLRDWVNNLWDSFNLFGDSAEEAAAKTDKLNKTLENTPERIAKIRKALNDLDWTKAQPPAQRPGALPGLGGMPFSDYAKQAGIFTGPTANTTKAIQDYVKELKSQRDELEIGSAKYKAITAEIERYERRISSATSATRTMTKEAKSAADIFNAVMTKTANIGEYYAVIGDDIGFLEAQHRDLESGMKAAWEAGGYGAANYVLELKRQRDETQKLMDGLKQMQKAKWETPAIASVSQRVAGGGAQIPGVAQFQTLKPLIASMQKEMAKANLLQAAFGDVNMIATEMQSLGQLISEGLEAGLDQSALQGYIDRWKELNEEQAKQAAFANVMTQVGDAAFNAFQAVGSGAQSASEGVRAFGVAAVSASLDAARGALVEAIMNNTKWLTKTMGPLGIPIALAGVGALFGLLKGAIGKSKGVQLAEGGIITGRTLAEVGEYPGASFNPEVVAPLDKLQAMLDVGGATHVTGTFRVNGSDLVVALDNAQRKMNKFRV